MFCALNDRARAAYGVDPAGSTDAVFRTITAGLQSTLPDFRQAATTPDPPGDTGSLAGMQARRQLCERYGWVGSP